MSHASAPAADAVGDDLPLVAQLAVGLHERTVLLRSQQVEPSAENREHPGVFTGLADRRVLASTPQ